MAVDVEAKNGGRRSITPLYWGWIRHFAAEEGVTIPESDSKTQSYSEPETKKIAAVIRVRARKIRDGSAPRDGTKYVEELNKKWFKPTKDSEGLLQATFDDPQGMEDTAKFFETSGGVTFRY